MVRFEDQLEYDEAVAVMSNQLHKEWRYLTWFLLTEDGQNYEQQIHFEEIFNETMDSLHVLEMFFETNEYLKTFEQIKQEDQRIKEMLVDFHYQVLNKNMNMDDARHFYEEVLRRLQNEVFTLERQEDGEDPHWEKLVAMETLLQVRNSLGTLHFLGQKYYYGKTFDVRDHNNFIGEIHVTREGIQFAKDHYPRVEILYKERYINNFQLYNATQAMITEILTFDIERNKPHEISMAIRWTDNMTSHARIVEDIELMVAEDIKNQVNEEKRNKATDVRNNSFIY